MTDTRLSPWAMKKARAIYEFWKVSRKVRPCLRTMARALDKAETAGREEAWSEGSSQMHDYWLHHEGPHAITYPRNPYRRTT